MYSRLIVHQFDPTRLQAGGVDTCISDLVAYAPAGATVDIVGVTSDDTRLGRWDEIEHRGRPIRFFAVALNKPARNFPVSARVAAGLARWRPRSPATLQCHRVDVAVAAKSAIRSHGHVQFIHNPHGRGPGVTGTGSDSFWRFAPRMYPRVEAHALVGARRIVVFSAAEAERLTSCGYPVTAWRTWFDPAVFSPVPKTRAATLRIACVGRLERQKDPCLAVDAIIDVCRRGLGVEATFVGGGPMLGVLRARVSASGFANAFRFVGETGRNLVAETLRRSDLLLLASHYEGSPRVVIESLATGTPVAATRAADPDCLVIHGATGAVASSRTPKALGDAVISAAACGSTACVAAVADLRADRVVPSLWDQTTLEA